MPYIVVSHRVTTLQSMNGAKKSKSESYWVISGQIEDLQININTALYLNMCYVFFYFSCLKVALENK